MAEPRSRTLCRYYLHSACTRGASCPFSHDLADAESQVRRRRRGRCRRPPAAAFLNALLVLAQLPLQVCRYYLKGACAYGSSCRYLHIKPDWSSRGQQAAAASTRAHAPPPTVPRPAADDLAEQLPISRLRLGGAAPDAAPLPLPLPLPVRLPPDPFGSAQGGGGGGGSSQQEQQPDAAGAYSHQQEGEQQEGGYGEQHAAAWEEQQEEEGNGYWVEGPDGEQFWVEGDGGEEEQWDQWEEEGWEEGDGGEEGACWEAGGEEEWEEEEQHGGLQPPASGGGGGGPRPAAWSLPAAAGGVEGEEQWAGSSHPALRSLCMQWFKTGTCAKGAACKLVHGQLCQVGWVQHMRCSAGPAHRQPCSQSPTCPPSAAFPSSANPSRACPSIAVSSSVASTRSTRVTKRPASSTRPSAACATSAWRPAPVGKRAPHALPASLPGALAAQDGGAMVQPAACSLNSRPRVALAPVHSEDSILPNHALRPQPPHPTPQLYCRVLGVPGAGAVQGGARRPPLRPADGVRPRLLPGLHPQLAPEDGLGGGRGHGERCF